MGLVSMSEYAKLRGVTRQAVSIAVKRGRISTCTDDHGNTRIDPEVADREWGRNTDPSKVRVEASGEPTPGASMHESEASLKAYKARMAQLQYEERAGLLVSAEEVQSRWTKNVGVARTKIMGAATKIKQRIPEITAEQFEEIEKIIRESLEDLADGTS